MKRDSLISTIILFMAGTAIIFFSVVPKYKDYTYLDSRLLELQSQYSDRLNYYKKLTDTVSKIESNQDFVNKMNSALPESDSASEIIGFLQNQSVENKLKIQSISFSKVSQSVGSNIKNISFTIDLYGQYYDFKKFLESLDKSSRIFEVASISFQS